MKPTRRLGSVLCALGATLGVSHAQLTLLYDDGRSFHQTGPKQMNFLGGELSVRVQDGNFAYDGCVEASPELVPSSGTCPGSTGYLIDGDVDGDGTTDQQGFYAIVEVVPNLLLAPFRPDECQLISAPPSKLPRPLGPFEDWSSLFYYNLLTPVVREFAIAGYEFVRTYNPGPGGLTRMKDEVIPGSYRFALPLTDTPGARFALAVTHLSTVEGYDPQDRPNIKEYFYFFPEPDKRTNNTGDPRPVYPWDAAGNVILNPQQINPIAWTGVTQGNTFPTDTAYVSIQIQDPATGLSQVVFPPSGVPLSLDTPYEQFYNLPPGLFEDGDIGTFVVQYERNISTDGVAFDVSTRRFSFDIRFVEP